MAFLVTGVFGDEVEVLAANDECAVHLRGGDGACEDTAADGDETSEGALLVCGATLLVQIPYSCSTAPSSDAWQLRVMQSNRWVPHTDVVAINGSLGCPETQTDLLVPSLAALALLAVLGRDLGVQEDVWLLLERALALDC